MHAPLGTHGIQTRALTIPMMMISTINVAIGLLALCRVGNAESSASSKIFDPNVFTDEEKQYIIDTYAGEGLKQYAKVRALSSHGPTPPTPRPPRPCDPSTP
jgi:hypothetical protein